MIYSNETENLLSLDLNKNASKQRSSILISIILLSLFNILNYCDRYLISSQLIEIEIYFNVNKSTLGLLQTIYLLSFVLVAPLVGYLGDKYKRKYLIIFSSILWLFSILTGSYLKQNQFNLFVLTRSLFGISTAFYECVSISLISDFYPNSSTKRTRAIFLFYLGPPIGTGLAFLLGNTISDIFTSDWRYVMRFTPICLIILLILIIIFFNEPLRSNSQLNISFKSGLKQLCKNKTFLLLTLTCSCSAASLVGFNWWSPSLIEYIFKNELKSIDEQFELKQIYSIIQTLTGLIGTLLPTEISNYLKKKFPNLIEIDCLLLSAGLLLSSISLYIYLLASNLNLILVMFLYALFTLFINTWRILMANILLDIVNPRFKSTANSILLFLLHLIGDSGSPYFIGYIND